MQTTVKSKIKGTLSFYNILDDGTWSFIHKTNNEVMYTGADLMAKAVVGDASAIIRGMYLEYSNATPSAPAVDRTRTPAYYEGLTGSAGYIRVPLTASPGYTPSTPSYTGNIVTIQAQTNGTYENGPGIIDGTSKIYSAALVAMPDPSDKAKDILFSAANTGVDIPKIANAQIGIKWELKFL
jgi:hypothetical protein